MFQSEIRRFLQSMCLASSTASHYERFISGFYWHCLDHDQDPATADAITAREWFETKKWSSSSMHSAAAALRCFYRWKYGEGHPMLAVKVRRVDPGPQRTLSEAEVAVLLESINTRTHKGVRDLALLTLLIDTGLRATEICSIQLRRLDLRQKRLTVQIKGGRWGDAVFFDYTANCLASWLAIRPLLADLECDVVFCSLAGRSPGKALTRYGLRTTIEQLGQKAGLEHFSPHAMRRTFATLATEYGAPTRMVQLAGRWRDIRMVETYTRKLDAAKLQPFSVVNRLMGVTEREQDVTGREQQGKKP